MSKLIRNLKKLEQFDLNSGLRERCADVLYLLPKQPDLFRTSRDSMQMEYERRNGDYLEFELYEDRIEWFLILNDEESEGEFSHQNKEKVKEIYERYY